MMPSRFHFEPPGKETILYPAHRWDLHFNRSDRTTAPVITGIFMLLENLRNMLMENGFKMLLENSNPPLLMLLQNGFNMLLENGGKMLLDTTNVIVQARMLLQNAFNMLLENAKNMVMENNRQ